MKQMANSFLMIEPISFGFNDQTAVNNYFQQKDNPGNIDIQGLALTEFKIFVEKLRSKGLDIIVVQDTLEPHTPDSIFPNNWISFHPDGRVAIYPMYAQNRRNERRNEILQLLKEEGFSFLKILDYTSFEKQYHFLEGTGSIVIDHLNKIAYAALSERTNKELFIYVCNDFDFKPVYFNTSQIVNGKKCPIYHTNVMMSICDKYAVVCLDSIENVQERNNVINSIVKKGKEIIKISEYQMLCFAGNILQVANKEGDRFLVMSQSAFDSLTRYQINRLSSFNEIITATIPTIEKYGGGSVRCMMAEIFN